MLLIFGELVVGALLYLLFKSVPQAVQIVFLVACWAISFRFRSERSTNKSLVSRVFVITVGATFILAIVARLTHGDAWFRLMTIGSCLATGLLLLDHCTRKCVGE